MAAGYLQHLAGDRIQVRSAGSQPADRINPVAVRPIRDDIKGRVEELIASLIGH